MIVAVIPARGGSKRIPRKNIRLFAGKPSAIRIAADGGVAPFFPQWIEQRSQDLEEAYHDAGAFYWGRAEAFRMGLPVFAAHSAALVLPPHRVQDIDNVGDWEHAERLYAALQIADSPPARV
jgi:pseudaminic acid cytidylyltransferase